MTTTEDPEEFKHELPLTVIRRGKKAAEPPTRTGLDVSLKWQLATFSIRPELLEISLILAPEWAWEGESRLTWLGSVIADLSARGFILTDVTAMPKIPNGETAYKDPLLAKKSRRVQSTAGGIPTSVQTKTATDPTTGSANPISVRKRPQASFPTPEKKGKGPEVLSDAEEGVEEDEAGEAWGELEGDVDSAFPV